MSIRTLTLSPGYYAGSRPFSFGIDSSEPFSIFEPVVQARTYINDRAAAAACVTSSSWFSLCNPSANGQ
ncbi:MAG: hypothetical protein ACLUHA_07680 [Bacteroides stercoris]